MVITPIASVLIRLPLLVDIQQGEMIGFWHSSCSPIKSILARGGSNGNSTIFQPRSGLATFHSGTHFQYKAGNKYRAQFYRLAQHAVLGPVTSSKRMAYPTFSPRSVSISSLTLFATLIAATRLGWVQPTIPFVVKPSSCKKLDKPGSIVLSSLNQFLQQPPQSDFREPPTQKLTLKLEKQQRHNATSLVSCDVYIRDTSDNRKVLAEEESRLDFPPYREPEDLTEEPDARIGVGDGVTLSQGEAAPVDLQSFRLNHLNSSMYTVLSSAMLLSNQLWHNTLPERGVWPPNHGETSRTSGEAPINIGDGEGYNNGRGVRLEAKLEVLGERSSENGRKRREGAERVELNQGRRPEAELQSADDQRRRGTDGGTTRDAAIEDGRSEADGEAVRPASLARAKPQRLAGIRPGVNERQRPRGKSEMLCKG
nr:hypothetical protein Iba_scaffold595CG0040 [Ipomoea batatas]